MDDDDGLEVAFESTEEKNGKYIDNSFYADMGDGDDEVSVTVSGNIGNLEINTGDGDDSVKIAAGEKSATESKLTNTNSSN